MIEWGHYKPVLTALASPPVPFLLLILVGARLILPRRGLGYLLVLLGAAGIWLSSCMGTAIWLSEQFLKPPAPVRGERQLQLEGLGKAYARQLSEARRKGQAPERVVPPAAIIVLGAGRDPLAREYGMADLSDKSIERLRYGIWLSRQTGLPLGFSGGVGWAQQRSGAGSPEAEVAARIAQDQFGWPLRWVESESLDTRQNAQRTVALLAEQGVGEVVVVTHAFHMARAMRNFERAAQHGARQRSNAQPIKVTAAPLAYWSKGERRMLDWLPTSAGAHNVGLAWKEIMGLLAGQ